ncbi:sensor histidine kinase [Pseudoduganella rhizocola]|uniref:sensor histidine kinase n=1 Tax=Pseudoduganella rhizocola TaxID=3382643 RepID=UPI0038B5221F
MLRTRVSRVVLTAWLLFWALMVTTAIQDFLRNDDGPLWHPVLWESSSAAVASVFMLIQRHYTRRYDALVAQPAKWFLIQLRWLPMYWILFVPFAFGIRHAVYALAGDTYPHAPWLQVYIYEDVKMTIFVSIFAVINFGILSYQAMQEEKLRAEQASGLLRSTQLQQLTQQMQPHFLFNALNTISSLMHTDVARADATLMRLAELLRGTLDAGRQQQVPLSTELRLLRAYAELMGERFAGRVDINWQVDEAPGDCLVPVLSLQPLLENVFKHTVERRRGAVNITVSAHCEGGRLNVIIEDDAGRLENTAPGGIGLRNLRERLAVLHSDAAAFTLEQRSPAGVRAKLELPCTC